MSLSKAASFSSSSSTLLRCAYDVFLSFRGEDTRTTFTDHLYKDLRQAGIRTFKDDDEIERGERIKLELDKAIEKSYVSIVVFSPNYASSRWCLDELVMINERMKAGLGDLLPIFYHVDPNHVRWQKASFEIAFARHEKRQSFDKMEKWRAALKEVADLSGEVLKKDQHEAPFIQNVIQIVRKKLNRQCLSVSPYVGIGNYLKQINSWLQDHPSKDVKILSIYGIGGVGKTTIAKIVYNQNYDKFEGSCFLSDVRQKSEKDGMPSLHEELLSKILKGKPIEKIYSVDEGVIKVQEAICCRKVLIVLDDVGNFKQFEQIVGQQERLFPGSKIILTTRSKSLFNGRAYVWPLQIKPLGPNDSFKLFKLHAFGQDNPPENLTNHSNRVVSYCGGLPLGLRILGSTLFGVRSIDLWESAVQEMQAIPNGDIQKILRISYDLLQNDYHQEIFLHIACFFIGMDQDVVVKILDGCYGFSTINGIQHLIDRCLIVNEYDKLMMHQLVRDMAREIIRKESPDEPGKRSRVWDYAEAFGVLTEMTGTETVKGLTLDLHMLKEDVCMKTISSHGKRCLNNSVGKSWLARQHNFPNVAV